MVQPITSSTPFWKLTPVKCLAVVITGIALLALAKFIHSLLTTKQPFPRLTFTPLFQHNLPLDQFQGLIMNCSQQYPRPSFQAIPIFDAKYIIYGPGFAAQHDNLDEVAFVELIRSSPDHHLIVNLMRSEEPLNYLDIPDVRSQIPLIIKNLSYNEGIWNTKVFYHFHAWPDKAAVPAEAHPALIVLAHKIAQAVQKGKIPFIHCYFGLQRSSTFVAIVEFLRRKNLLADTTDAGLALYMKHIIEELAKTQFRVPTLKQMEMLLDPTFLRKLFASS